MKNYNMILTEKQPKYQDYHLLYFTCEVLVPLDQSLIKKQAKFTYPPLGKDLEKQEKQLKMKLKSKQKTTLRHRSKINRQFVFKRFFIRKS